VSGVGELRSRGGDRVCRTLAPALVLSLALVGCARGDGGGARRDGEADPGTDQTEASDTVQWEGAGTDLDAAAEHARDQTGSGEPAAADQSVDPHRDDALQDTAVPPDIPACEAAGSPAPTTAGLPVPQPWGGPPRFDDATPLLGDAAVYAFSASWGDVNGDLWPDLVIPGPRTETSLGSRASKGTVWATVQYGCAGSFARASVGAARGQSTPDQYYAHGSDVVDLDGDGRLDIVATWTRGAAIALQGADGTFTPRPLDTNTDGGVGRQFWGVTPFDFDVDGDLDLMLTVYDGPNSVMRNDGGGSFVEQVTGAASALYDPTDYVSYSATVVVGPPGRVRPLLYVANDGFGPGRPTVKPDYVFAMPGPWQFDPVPLPDSPDSSMGVDFAHLDDGETTLVAVSQTGSFPVLVLRGETLTPLSPRVDGMRPVNSWAVLFDDFDMDGREELFYASGRQEGDVPRGATMPPASGHLFMFCQEGETTPPRLRDCSAGVGELFNAADVGDFMSAAIADFDRDGCPDIVVTPVFRSFLATQSTAPSTPIRLLRNRCYEGMRWVGLDIPDRRGVVYQMVGSDAEGNAVTRYREHKVAAGSGSHGAAQIRFSLAGVDTLDRIEVHCTSGAVERLEAATLTLNAYNDVRGLCGTVRSER